MPTLSCLYTLPPTPSSHSCDCTISEPTYTDTGYNSDSDLEAIVGEEDKGKGHGKAGDKGKGEAIVGEEDKGKGTGKAGDKGKGEAIVGEEDKGKGKAKAGEGKGEQVAQRGARTIRSAGTRCGELCRLYLLEDASPRTPSSSSS
jgi:hypothetical protein